MNTGRAALASSMPKASATFTMATRLPILPSSRIFLSTPATPSENALVEPRVKKIPGYRLTSSSCLSVIEVEVTIG